MKLRYYLRGLGTGIVVTALILSRLTGAARPLTDAEIRAKALTLGMVDADSLSLSDVAGDGGQNPVGAGTEITASPEPEETPGQEEPVSSEEPGGEEGPDPADTSEPEEIGAPVTSPEVTASPEPEESATPEPTPSPSPSPTTDTSTPAPAETVTLVISRGDSSYTVSRRLVEAGLVENAREFDAYLVDNGYSRTIRTGTYQIPVGASWKEIAEIIA